MYLKFKRAVFNLDGASLISYNKNDQTLDISINNSAESTYAMDLKSEVRADDILIPMMLAMRNGDKVFDATLFEKGTF